MAFKKKETFSQMVSRSTSDFRFSFLPCRWRQHSSETPVPIEDARSTFEPGNRFPWDVTVLFKTNIKIFTVCVDKSTSVLLTLLIRVLGSPLSNSCCRCSGIVLQNGCQVANRVTDVCGEALSTGWLRKYQGSEQEVCVLWWTLSGLTSMKEFVFCYFDLANLPCRRNPHPPTPIPDIPLTRRITRKTGNTMYRKRRHSLKGHSFKTRVHRLHPILSINYGNTLRPLIGQHKGNSLWGPRCDCGDFQVRKSTVNMYIATYNNCLLHEPPLNKVLYI